MKPLLGAVLFVAAFSLAGRATGVELSRSTINAMTSQKKPAETQPKTNKSPKSDSDSRATEEKDAQKPITGKVIRVNDKEKTFVILANGKETTFAGRKMKKLPKTGDAVVVKPNAAKFIFNSCEECNAKCPGVCFLGANYCRCYLEPLPTN